MEKISNINFNQEKLIDLHTHTSYSDGELTPDELVDLALKTNVGTLAITDHDTILGLKNISKDKFEKTRIISGIELSVRVEKGQMHILGYGIDKDNVELNNTLEQLYKNNRNYFISLIQILQEDYNIEFVPNEVEKLINGMGNLGRPHIAKLLMKYGYVNSVQEAFDKYLVDIYNKVGYVKGMDYKDCIELILKSGGIPVLAHPKTLKLSSFELINLIKHLVDCGLQGIEVYHSMHSDFEASQYIQIANELNLLVSGGSDFHGYTSKPDIKLGTGRDNLKIKKLSVLEKLK